MDDNRFTDVIRELPRSFNEPPPPPLDEMWTVIEEAHFDAPVSISKPRGFASRAPWLAAAAALVLGIGLGRYLPRGANPTEPAPSAVAANSTTPTPDTSAVADAYRDQTNRYLGQAAALLISLPARDGSGKTDATFATKATDLLVTTRLLIDSPAATQDPKLHSLLEDLELVLVQIARLHTEKNKGDLDLIHQAVEQGDVLSRLNSAVATTQSSE
ncbi:MAG TPA: hypothetical protein VK560_05725 [Gemmatimonadaceae bacterium]|nr:hypothetical protein [Gemmatimonadaceae bacterium]